MRAIYLRLAIFQQRSLKEAESHGGDIAKEDSTFLISDSSSKATPVELLHTQTTDDDLTLVLAPSATTQGINHGLKDYSYCSLLVAII